MSYHITLIRLFHNIASKHPKALRVRIPGSQPAGNQLSSGGVCHTARTLSLPYNALWDSAARKERVPEVGGQLKVPT